VEGDTERPDEIFSKDQALLSSAGMVRIAKDNDTARTRFS
jgi:hypothetical protein